VFRYGLRKFNIKDKQIILTGGSKGIGKVVADHLGRNGANLSIIARTKAELCKTEEEFLKKGYKIKAFSEDVQNIEQIKEIISSIGTVDVLINCAGVQGEIGPFYNINYKKWKETFEINFYGTLNCITAALPFMLKEKRGKIINFSGGGANYSRPNFSAYGVSKAAIVRLTETLADELKAYNIQVNAVSPGTVKTKMIDEILNEDQERVGEEYNQVKLKLSKGFDSGDLVAELVCYLASSESDWITGKVISAAWDPWKKWRDTGHVGIDKDIYVLRRIDGRNYIRVNK